VSPALGIDHGEKRIGLAVSDALAIAAHGLPTLVRTTLAEDLAAIAAIVKQRDIHDVVLGLPRNMDGSLGPQARLVEAFAEKLKEALSLPVHFVDERLTTEQAERALIGAGVSRLKRRKHIDRMAAQFILQQFLDRRRVQGEEALDL